MSQFITANQTALTLIAGVFATLCAMAFGGILNWRHKICLDYESRRDVAINILRDRFVQRTSKHYSDIEAERGQSGVGVEEIYKRPEKQSLIRGLARDLEDQNSVRRLFRLLELSSRLSFGLVWAAIVLLIVGVLLLWFKADATLFTIWGVMLGCALLGFFVFVSSMWVLDGRFFGLVHRIIEPEGE